MALFGLGKKMEEEVNKGCCCGNQVVNTCCGGEVEEICSIKVLGAGCKSCHEQFENAKKAVEELGLSIEVKYITDMEKVMTYGVMSMPAIVVNEKVVSMGKVLKSAEVIKLLEKLGMQEYLQRLPWI